MPGSWTPTDRGVMALPSGLLVRGRGLRNGPPDGPAPDFGLYLLGSRPQGIEWAHEWVRWPDFRLPSDPAAFARHLDELFARSAGERVEVACGGGVGRTGTALACLAVLDGVPAEQAVGYVREHYAPRAVETPWQARFVRRFGPVGPGR